MQWLRDRIPNCTGRIHTILRGAAKLRRATTGVDGNALFVSCSDEKF